jgi:predicted PurR-regulated permease PerM
MQYVVFGAIILYFGRDIFVPISFALLISFVMYPVCVWLERKGIGRLLAIIATISVLVIAVLLLVALLVNQFIAFLHEWPILQMKVGQSWEELSQVLTNLFGVTKEQQDLMISKMNDQSGSNFVDLFRSTLNASIYSAVLFILIPVYAVLILFYRNYWVKILMRMFPSENKESMIKMLSLTIQTYYNFIKGMLIVYLVVGILNSAGLLLLGIPHAFLFGFITSILTFIPYIGIMVGAMLPVALAWITYDSIWYPVGVIGIFMFVQYLEANVIFPIAVSSRLNVNTLVMLIAIFAGGILWGLSGMILFVPFVGIAKIIADHNPKWKTISMIIGLENIEK